MLRTQPFSNWRICDYFVIGFEVFSHSGNTYIIIIQLLVEFVQSDADCLPAVV